MKQFFFINLFCKLLYSILFVVSLLPMKILFMVSNCIYIVGYHVLRYREKVVIQNLSRSFPEMNYREIQGVCKKFYRSFSDCFVEILKTLSMSPLTVNERVIFVDFQIVKEFISQNKNVIAFMGHCGNWEILNFIPQMLQQDVYAVYKPLRSKAVNYLIVRLRARFGMKLIAVKSITKHLLRKKDDAAVYFFLADQCPKIVNEKNQLTFLNQQTGVYTGVEKLACAIDSAVVYLNVIRTSRGYYRATCIPICSEAKQTTEMEITKKYIHLLEENIKEEPSGWLWSHKRWKR